MIQFLSAYTDPERRIACLKALLNASNFEYFKVDFAEKGIIDVLLDIQSNFGPNASNSQDNPLDLRELSFNIISNICENTRSNQKEFRRKGGIELIK